MPRGIAEHVLGGDDRQTSTRAKLSLIANRSIVGGCGCAGRKSGVKVELPGTRVGFIIDQVIISVGRLRL